MPDRTDIERVVAATRYLVIASVGDDGRPWATPVFFALVGEDRLCWVSSPDSRHSRNIAARPEVALTVFDSTVAVGHAEAAYFDARAYPAPEAAIPDALHALNRRLPPDRQLDPDDLAPAGSLVLYLADIAHRYLLVRGGDAQQGNELDVSREV
ncbi:pyridoxamine 5'-phosphate oxidase family protein [Leifsonia sp. NPDC102414]|uniref:pyridoxamine 5'-phosphate oxidase family protein n=1 Tax=Leifsonia sp. NPDC102414 TaxID=3364124 RepID=UPI00382A14B0